MSQLAKQSRDVCAVCGERRDLDDLNIYIKRIYSTSSSEHRDFSLNYCRDNPTCMKEVEYLPWSMMQKREVGVLGFLTKIFSRR